MQIAMEQRLSLCLKYVFQFGHLQVQALVMVQFPYVESFVFPVQNIVVLSFSSDP